MFKIIIGLFFIISLSDAKIISIECKNNLKNMVKFYYLAQKESDAKNNNKALLNFQKSYTEASLALEHCQDEEDYDFNHIYNYLSANEKKIQKIKEDMLEFPLIKN